MTAPLAGSRLFSRSALVLSTVEEMWSALWEETKTGREAIARAGVRQYVRWEYGEADPSWLLRRAAQEKSTEERPGFLERGIVLLRTLVSRDSAGSVQ